MRRLFCIALLFSSELSGQLDVPFLSQVPPPSQSQPENISLQTAWNNTHNCGQTSVLMVMAKHSRRALSPQDIKDADDFIYQKWPEDLQALQALLKTNNQAFNRYYGYYTGGRRINRLIALAKEFDHGFGIYSDTTSPSVGGTRQLLKTELALGPAQAGRKYLVVRPKAPWPTSRSPRRCWPVSKKRDLISKAQASVRAPQPERLQEPRRAKPGYRIVAVSLYTPEADWIDKVTHSLKMAGNAKANRSLVVREAILRLQESLKEKEPTEILGDFTTHQARRVQGRM